MVDLRNNFNNLFPSQRPHEDLDGILDEYDSRRSSMNEFELKHPNKRSSTYSENEVPSSFQEFLDDEYARLQEVLAEQHARAIEFAGVTEDEISFLRSSNELLQEELRKANISVPESAEGSWCVSQSRSLRKRSKTTNGHATGTAEVPQVLVEEKLAEVAQTECIDVVKQVPNSQGEQASSERLDKVSPAPPPAPAWKPVPMPSVGPDKLQVDQSGSAPLPGALTEIQGFSSEVEDVTSDDCRGKPATAGTQRDDQALTTDDEIDGSAHATAAPGVQLPAADQQSQPAAGTAIVPVIVTPCTDAIVSVHALPPTTSSPDAGLTYASHGSDNSYELKNSVSELKSVLKEEADPSQGVAAGSYQDLGVRCTQCGNIFMADARFCRKCGAPRAAGDVVGLPFDTDAQDIFGNMKEAIVKGTSAGSRLASPRHTLGALPQRGSGLVSFDHSLSGRHGHKLSLGGQRSRGPSRSGRDSHALKKDGKERFEVLPMWRPKRDGSAAKVNGPKLKKVMGTRLNNSFLRRVTHRSIEHEDVAKLQKQHTWVNRFCRIPVIHPNSPRRGTWDVISLFLVLYDMAFIPLQFFEPPEGSFSSSMLWITRLFWTIDMPSSFLTGYVTTDGFIVMKPSKIMWRYVKSWFLLDVLIVSTDWLELVMSANSSLGFARMGKASRTFRIIRMLRLLRLARMREVLALITERINSEKVVIVADIMKIMIIIIATAHFIACMWYGVAMAQDDPFSWVAAHGFARASLGARYTMSLHWSIAQFAGGMDEITPESTGERVFAICMFILAFIMASVFVSSITSSMTQLNIIGSHQSQQLSTLRRYLHQNGISNKLAMRVQRNAQHAVTEQQRTLPEHSVGLLNMVSEPLRVEIHLEMYSPVFTVHPWFRSYIDECPQVMRKVCHSATSMMTLSSGDVIFSAGEIPSSPKMYFVCAGVLVYHIGHKEQELYEGMWIAEASLWTHWMHRGMFMATTDCRLCVLDAKRFQHIVDQFEHSEFDPTYYAAEFISSLNALEEPSDLIIDSDMVSRSVSEIQDKKTGLKQAWWMHTPCAPFVLKARRFIRHHVMRRAQGRRSMSRLRLTQCATRDLDELSRKSFDVFQYDCSSDEEIEASKRTIPEREGDKK